MNQKDILNIIFHNVEPKLKTKPGVPQLEHNFTREFIYDQMRKLILDNISIDIRKNLLNLFQLFRIRLANIDEDPKFTYKDQSIGLLDLQIERLEKSIDSYKSEIEKDEDKKFRRRKFWLDILKFVIPTLISIAALVLSLVR